jgi:Protein of unknown function (DUF1003)
VATAVLAGSAAGLVAAVRLLGRSLGHELLPSREPRYPCRHCRPTTIASGPKSKGGAVSIRPPPMPINPALLKHAEQRRQSLENRVADQITRFAGSMQFVYIHVIWFAAWIGFRVEQYPFGLLTMIVSLEAIFLSTFVMSARTGRTRSGRCWPTRSGRRSRRRIGRPAAARPVQPDPGAHQGHPRAGRGTVGCPPGWIGWRLTWIPPWCCGRHGGCADEEDRLGP